MAQYDFTKTINSDKLKVEISAAGLSAPSSINTNGTAVSIIYASDLSSENQTTLSTTVTNHVAQTTAEYLRKYLDGTVYPFTQGLIATFAAENIAMGVTQAGKADDLLGLFGHHFDIGSMYPVSLKSAFDTGSLYVSLVIIQHWRDNPSVYDGLSPFVTDARLLTLKNRIETFLGAPLST